MSDADKLEIKKRARRRLVGAAALALLAAIVLPMAMDQEPQQSNQDIQISIPDRQATANEARPIAPNQVLAPVDPDVAPAPVELPPVATQSPPVPPPPVPQPPAATPPASTSDTPPAASKPPLSKEDEAARVKALLSGAPVASAASAESMVIQVGAFSDDAKAVALAADLKKQGFAAYTEKAGKVTRVRVGPVPGRSDADKLAAKLRAQGHNAVIAPR